MSTTVVRNTIVDIGGAPQAGVQVRISLVSSATGPAPAYATGESVIIGKTVLTDATGLWSVSLVPNAEISPAGTYYQVAEAGLRSAFEVPVGGGPYTLLDLLVSPPTAPGLVSGVGDLSRTVPEGMTIAFDRPTLVDQPTAADTMVFRYNGSRTGYHNEYGEFRAIPAANNTVPWRVKQKSNAQTANLTEWVDIGNGVLASVGPTGAFTVPGLTIGSTAVAVGAWADLALPAGMSHGTVHAAARAEPFGIVRLRGSVVSDVGTGFTAGVTLATLPAGKRPAAVMTFPSRQATAGIALTINTDGTITSATTIGSGGGIAVLLDNITLATT